MSDAVHIIRVKLQNAPEKVMVFSKCTPEVEYNITQNKIKKKTPKFYFVFGQVRNRKVDFLTHTLPKCHGYSNLRPLIYKSRPSLN